MESFEEPRVASATARRHGISGSLLFAWRKAFREGRLSDAEFPGFAPAMIVSEDPTPALPPGAGSRIEIATRDGYRVIVEGAVDTSALTRVLDVLERR